MKKTVLITGASGFIGSAICKRLMKEYKVVGIVSPFSKSTRLQNTSNKIEIVKSNLADEKQVAKIFKKYSPTYVLHLATHGVYTYQQQDEERIVVDNYLMTVNLLKYSAELGVNKFINTGSVFEYGSRKGRVKEEDVNMADILNKYSAVKMATTALANSYSQKINVITLRPFTTFGPFEDETRFIQATINRALANEPIRLVKNVVRDFVYVDDVVEAYVAAVKRPFTSGEIINVASGKKMTLEQVASLIKKTTKSKSKIIIDETYKRSKESACWADVSRAKKVLRWSPKITVLRGVKKMLYCLHNANQEGFTSSK